MKLVEPKLWQIEYLCESARNDEIEQYEALTGVEWDADRMAVDLFGRDGVRAVLLASSGEPIVAGGWQPVRPGCYESWMIGTYANWDAHWRAITRYSRRMMDVVLGAPENRRLQTQALASRVKACEWYVRGLGMHHEFTMPQAGAGGEDVAMFARLKGA
jgi:hypothetical protein